MDDCIAECHFMRYKMELNGQGLIDHEFLA